jgi:hypothetical protein
LPNCALRTNLRREVLIYVNVMRSTFENKPDMVSTVVARWERLSIDARDFVLLSVYRVVDDPINAGSGTLFTWFKYLSARWLRHTLLLAF